MTTKIEWTERVWNPVTGCSKVSEACHNCYAEVMAKRLQGMPASKEKYKNGFRVTLHPECLDEPFQWKKPARVFVCSMGDLFHEDVPFDFVEEVRRVMVCNPQHTFQILTKRAYRMNQYFKYQIVPGNVLLGVTCESPQHYNRVRYLREIDSGKVKFVSCEPLLGDVFDINLRGIGWVITGGESGTCARRTPVDWFRNLRDHCIQNNVPFFFKQCGAYGEDGVKRSKYKNGCLLDGREWKEYPRPFLTTN
jgi:protein gp37